MVVALGGRSLSSRRSSVPVSGGSIGSPVGVLSGPVKVCEKEKKKKGGKERRREVRDGGGDGKGRGGESVHRRRERVQKEKEGDKE